MHLTNIVNYLHQQTTYIVSVRDHAHDRWNLGKGSRNMG